MKTCRPRRRVRRRPRRPQVGPRPISRPNRARHLLARCPVLDRAETHRDEDRRLSHEEQLVLIHTLGHVEGGPQAVNYLLGKCLDVGPEKLLKDRLKGNSVSCPSIRKKIGHVTRRVDCNCPFDFAPDRYPTPVLHLLTLPAGAAPSTVSAADAETLAPAMPPASAAGRDAARTSGSGADAARTLELLPGRAVGCPGGRYRLVEREGVEELLWEEDGDSRRPGANAASVFVCRLAPRGGLNVVASLREAV